MYIARLFVLSFNNYITEDKIQMLKCKKSAINLVISLHFIVRIFSCFETKEKHIRISNARNSNDMIRLYTHVSSFKFIEEVQNSQFRRNAQAEQ